MKKIFFLFFCIFMLVGCISNSTDEGEVDEMVKTKGKKEIISGLAQESKAGLVVDGIVFEDHPMRCKPVKKGEPVSQCFDMPVMQNITSIKEIQVKEYSSVSEF